MSDVGLQNYFSIENFRRIRAPLLDIRSPSEFLQGHWPGAINLPLFNDEERATVGKTYKKQGRLQAILLGLEITIPKIERFKDFLENLNEANSENSEEDENKNCLRLYCWRGGMRSASIGWVANILNLKPIILTGGYKSYRKWVLAQFQKEWPLRLLGGKTGTGKTDLLLSMKQKGINIIDLEGLANHRGSSFGGLGLPLQPSTEHYENLIAENLDVCNINPENQIWLEAESSNLGCCRIPHELFKQMKQAPIVEINRSKEERISQLVKVYAIQSKKDLKAATTRISRRLGPQRTELALNAINNEEWEQVCEALLDYYDKCYEYELSKSAQRKAIDISGLESDSAAIKLLTEGLID